MQEDAEEDIIRPEIDEQSIVDKDRELFEKIQEKRQKVKIAS